jgi:protein SCO1
MPTETRRGKSSERSSLLGRITAVLATGLALALVASACGLPFVSDDEDIAGRAARAGASGQEPRSVLLPEPVPAADFTLVAQTGEPFQRSSVDGQVVAVFFGYTGCPDICPLTLSHMASAVSQIEDHRDDVVFLFVTVDPERDTPERLATYIERVDAPVIGLTGSPELLAAVWSDYDITVERHERPDGNDLVDHSAQIWLIDREGMLRGFLPMGADGDDLASELRWLVGEDS